MPRDAVIVTAVAVEVPGAVTAKVVLIDPAGTTMLCGIETIPELLESVMSAPPVGAGAFKVSVPVLTVPAATLAGFRMKEASRTLGCDEAGEDEGDEDGEDDEASDEDEPPPQPKLQVIKRPKRRTPTPDRSLRWLVLGVILTRFAHSSSSLMNAVLRYKRRASLTQTNWSGSQVCTARDTSGTFNTSLYRVLRSREMATLRQL